MQYSRSFLQGMSEMRQIKHKEYSSLDSYQDTGCSYCKANMLFFV